jgi:hypothetical protein
MILLILRETTRPTIDCGGHGKGRWAAGVLRRRLRPVAGQVDAEGRALTSSGFGVNASAVCSGDRARDREAEAAPSAVARAAVIEAVESFEDLFELVGWDAWPGVADGNLESAVLCTCGDGYSVAGVGVGDGVADELAFSRSVGQ